MCPDVELLVDCKELRVAEDWRAVAFPDTLPKPAGLPAGTKALEKPSVIAGARS